MNRYPIKFSSNLKSQGYDASTQTLEIEFNSGAVWRYSPVSEELFGDFMSAQSKGSFFSTQIKGDPDIKAAKVEVKQ